MEEFKNGIKAFYAATQAEWHNWLMENHEKETSVWLILYKKNAPEASLPHTNAVDEALCLAGSTVLPSNGMNIAVTSFSPKESPKAIGARSIKRRPFR